MAKFLDEGLKRRQLQLPDYGNKNNAAYFKCQKI
jgi:hypothetical protein